LPGNSLEKSLPAKLEEGGGSRGALKTEALIRGPLKQSGPEEVLKVERKVGTVQTFWVQQEKKEKLGKEKNHGGKTHIQDSSPEVPGKT